MTHEDDQTRRLLQSADPARTLPALRSDDLHRRMETAMTPTPATSQSKKRGWIFAGAGGVALAAAAALLIPTAVGPAMGSTTLDQVASGGPAAMCAEVTPESIAAGDSAFRADVAGVDGQVVTLRVTDRFKGDVKDTVITTQGDGAGIDGEPLVFEPGTSYLITTREGVIASCGLSGPDTPELNALYQEVAGR